VLDGADMLVDRVVVPIATNTAVGDGPECRICIDALKHKAIAVARRRIKAIARRRARGVEALIARECAMAEATGEESGDRELQPGLFDLRDVRAFEIEEREIADIQLAAENAARYAELAADLRAGEPVLEIVLSGKK
jgi:hypothetical protein